MSFADLLVIAGALAAVAWVNWYFFLAEKSSAEGGGSRREDREPGR